MSYSFTKRLPSCFIERKLLLELEDYVQRKATDFVSSDDSICRYEFTIIDSSGSEILKSVEDYKRTFFPDDIERIKIMYSSRLKGGLSIEISFGTIKEFTKAEIWFDGNSAREVAIGISSEIVSILESYKTSSHWFHLYNGVPIALILNTVLYAILIALPGLNLTPVSLIYLFLLGIFSGTMTFIFIAYFKPYSTFETRRNERRKKHSTGYCLGVFGFILFTVIGVYLRLKLFGF